MVQNISTPDACLLPGGVMLPFDVNLLDFSFTMLLAAPFRDLRGTR